jgi:hypothetical protein
VPNPTWPSGTDRNTRMILAAITRLEHQLTTGLDDLNTQIAALQAAWTTLLADLGAILANPNLAEDAKVEQAAQLIAPLVAAIGAEDAVVNPPAPPAP